MLVRAILALALFTYAHRTNASEAEAANLCRGDALRLCFGEIPDRERIIQCMELRKAELSPRCRAVFHAPKHPPVLETVSK